MQTVRSIWSLKPPICYQCLSRNWWGLIASVRRREPQFRQDLPSYKPKPPSHPLPSDFFGCKKRRTPAWWVPHTFWVRRKTWGLAPSRLATSNAQILRPNKINKISRKICKAMVAVPYCISFYQLTGKTVGKCQQNVSDGGRSLWENIFGFNPCQWSLHSPHHSSHLGHKAQRLLKNQNPAKTLKTHANHHQCLN